METIYIFLYNLFIIYFILRTQQEITNFFKSLMLLNIPDDALLEQNI